MGPTQPSSDAGPGSVYTEGMEKQRFLYQPTALVKILPEPAPFGANKNGISKVRDQIQTSVNSLSPISLQQ